MKTYFMFLLLLPVLCFAAPSPEFAKPDLALIRRESRNPKSLYYYPVLLSRCQGGDTSLSVDEYRYLYYGSGFQPESDADTGQMASQLSVRDSIAAIVGQKDSLSPADYLRLIPFYQTAIKADPFAIRYLSKLATAYRKTGQQDLYRVYRYRFNTLLDAILSTGDGSSVESAWYVTDIGHEYDIIWAFGLTFGGSQSLVGGMTCDYLTLAPNQYKKEGFYFNVEISMARLNEMMGGSKPAKGKSKKKKNILEE